MRQVLSRLDLPLEVGNASDEDLQFWRQHHPGFDSALYPKATYEFLIDNPHHTLWQHTDWGVEYVFCGVLRRAFPNATACAVLSTPIETDDSDTEIGVSNVREILTLAGCFANRYVAHYWPDDFPFSYRLHNSSGFTRCYMVPPPLTRGTCVCNGPRCNLKLAMKRDGACDAPSDLNKAAREMGEGLALDVPRNGSNLTIVGLCDGNSEGYKSE